MYQKIPFAQRQGLRPVDLNRLQDAVRRTFDKQSQFALLRATYYGALSITKLSATEVQASSGVLFQAGGLYINDDPVTINLAASLPLGSNRRIVAIVATGVEADTASEQVRFLNDVATRSSVANTVTVERTRKIEIQAIPGTESLAPIAPAVDVSVALLSLVELSSSGIVGLPDQQTDQKAPNLQDMYAQQLMFESVLSGMQAQINSLRADLAGLARLLQGKADRAEISRHELQLRDLREVVGIADTNAWLGADSFSNADESDTGHADYDARVEGGNLLGPAPAAVVKQFALLNPTDPKLKYHATLALPDYTEEVRYELTVRETTVIMASLLSVTHARTKKTPGYMFKWFRGSHGGLADTIRKTGGVVKLRDPETGNTVTIDLDKYDWEVRGTFGAGAWIYIADYKPYWAVKYSSANITGAVVAQTWLNAQAGWLTAVSLYVKELGANGDVRLNVFECNEQHGPDLGNTLEEVVVAYADLKVGWNKIVLPDPVHMSKGVYYGFSVKTSGAHVLWASNTNDAKGGTLFFAVGGVWDPQVGLDLSHRLHTARFKKARVEVTLDPVEVAGGISEMDFTMTGIRPSAADFDVVASIAGVYRAIDETDPTVFASEPNLVPLKAVWTNAPTDAVAIDIAKSKIVAYKPDNSGVHISTARTLPGGGEAATITVDYYFRAYDPAHHTATPRLLHGVGYATEKTPASSTWTNLAGGFKRLRSVYTFTSGNEIASFKRKISFTTDTAAIPVVIDRVYDFPEA